MMYEKYTKPNVDDIFAGKMSKYALAIAVAKRARKITDDMRQDKGKVCDKPSYDVSDTDVVEVAFDALKYVSRGGYKLAGALEKFRIDFSGKTILDIG